MGYLAGYLAMNELGQFSTGFSWTVGLSVGIPALAILFCMLPRIKRLLHGDPGPLNDWVIVDIELPPLPNQMPPLPIEMPNNA